MSDRAIKALAEASLPGEPLTYDARSKRSGALLTTLYYRDHTRPSTEAMAIGQLKPQRPARLPDVVPFKLHTPRQLATFYPYVCVCPYAQLSRTASARRLICRTRVCRYSSGGRRGWISQQKRRRWLAVMVGSVEWLHREHRLVVLVKCVWVQCQWSSATVRASPNLFNMYRQSCANGLCLKISLLELLLPLPNFIDVDLK